MKKYFPYLIIFLAVLTFWLPIIIKPELFLARDNDLNEFFFPIYYFVKDQIINHHTFPLWNNLFLSGTPLLPDPQSPLFYFPNIIFLILPIGASFMISSFAHIFLGGVGMYLTSKKGFGFTNKASLISAIIYIFTPRLAGYLVAGHVGLIESWAWVPFVILSILMIVKEKKIKWSILLGISMTGLFFTHTFNFVIISFASVVFLFFANKFTNKRKYIKPFRFFGLGTIIAFGLTAITLIPQYLWQGTTNRTLLLTKPQIFPIWTSKIEFLKAVITPWLMKENIQEINTEQWIVAGVLTTIVCLFGLIKLNKKILLIFLFFSLIVLLITLGNASPIYTFLFRMDWYRSMRIPTRVWVIFLVIIPILIGFAVDKYKNKLVTLLAILAIFETLLLSWTHITKPIVERAIVSEEIYSILAEDKELYRVICLHRCISQKEAAIRHLELVDGYSTLTQLNYFRHSWQLTGGYWDYYALSIPPSGVYIFQDLQPSAKSLGEYNTKYILSNHILEDLDFKLIDKFEDIYFYKNSIVKPRNYEFYTPNHIRLDTKNFDNHQIILSEVYSPGWKAYLNGSEEVKVQETPNALRAVDIKTDTKFVDLIYKPNSYTTGKIITLGTILILTLVFIIKSKIFNKK